MNKKPERTGLENPGTATRVVWGGEQVRHPYNATQPPIVASAAYAVSYTHLTLPTKA
mgnify:CR=1 FL=1